MDKNRKATGELDSAQRSKELQTQGGTDLDTTDLDGPSGLERDGDDLVGENKPEWGPLTVVPVEKDLPAPMDPSGEDPFVPGTREAPPNFDADELLSDREKHVRQVVHDQDPLGKKGPTYEVNQGTNERTDGGSTDPNNDLTHDSSGLKEE